MLTRLARSRSAVGALLMNQQVIAGIGPQRPLRGTLRFPKNQIHGDDWNSMQADQPQCR